MCTNVLWKKTKRAISTPLFRQGNIGCPQIKWAWAGMVVGISDGDTITVLHDGKAIKIRLYGIDKPEKRQAFGKRAKQFTSGMVYAKTVEVETKDTDRYGRSVALNISMVNP